MQMHAEIKFIHHVGHIVSDMEAALELYRKLGFVCSPPSYPAMAENEGESLKPFGAANSHAEFLGRFIEIVTVAEKDARIPINAKLVPLQTSPDVLQVIIEKSNALSILYPDVCPVMKERIFFVSVPRMPTRQRPFPTEWNQS